MNKIRKNDQVIVTTGKDKGKIGRVILVLPKAARVFVEKVNLVKRHTKPTQKNPQGGVVEKEAPIHISNVRLLDPKSGEKTRIGIRADKGKKRVRYSKKSNELIEAK